MQREEALEARGAARAEEQEPRRHRVERAAVADAGNAEGPAHALDDVVRREARRLVDQEEEARARRRPATLGPRRGSSSSGGSRCRPARPCVRRGAPRSARPARAIGRRRSAARARTAARTAAPTSRRRNPGGAVEGRGRLAPAPRRVPRHGEVDARGPQVRRHLDVGDRDLAQHRVVRLDQDEARDLRPHEVGDALAAAGVFMALVARSRSSHMDELILDNQDLAVQVRFDEAQDVLQQRVERRLVGPHGGDAELRRAAAGPGRPTSAAETSNSFRIRLFRLFTIIRFSLSPRQPGRCRSKTA